MKRDHAPTPPTPPADLMAELAQTIAVAQRRGETPEFVAGSVAAWFASHPPDSARRIIDHIMAQQEARR